MKERRRRRFLRKFKNDILYAITFASMISAVISADRYNFVTGSRLSLAVCAVSWCWLLLFLVVNSAPRR